MDKSKQASKARERRLRAKYRRNIRTAVVLSLVIGLAVGFVAGRMTASAPSRSMSEPDPTRLVTLMPEVTVIPTPTAMPTPTAVPSSAPVVAIVTTIPTPTAEATAVATAEVAVQATAETTAEATVKPASTAVTVVPFGQTQNIAVQAYTDGTPRTDAQPLPYETLNFKMTVTRRLDNEYYVSNYGSTHRLEEGTAGIEFELMLDNYQGATTIDPNVLIKNVSVETADGLVTYGYRFTNAEISGSDKFTMQTNVPMTLYKRFTQSESPAVYLVVTVKNDGVDQVYKFELAGSAEPTPEPTPEVTYTALSKGDNGDAVKALQARLIEKGYLESGSDDGIYGSGTAEAVKAAQADLDMEADGIAGPEFQSALFAAN